VYDDGSGELLADLRTEGQRFVAASGGKGGRGNIHFATSTDRAPRRAEPGQPGEERVIRLELKLLADVGLVGFPNVGKSSLITRISAARPKIADYPFTTLIPHLGMVRLSDDRSFVVADVPGLIEGAHQGAGLGHRFLRHLERTRVLAHLLELSSIPGRTALRDYQTLRRELGLHDPALAGRREVVVINKLDLPATRKKFPALERAFARRGLRILGVSAATGEGIPALLGALWTALEQARAAEVAARATAPGTTPRDGIARDPTI
jgi:GTP-binding protein